MELIQMKPCHKAQKARLMAKLKVVKRESHRREAIKQYRKDVLALRHIAKANLLDLSTLRFID
jgi:hypothetical protein